jgi:hypothetical protein
MPAREMTVDGRVRKTKLPKMRFTRKVMWRQWMGFLLVLSTLVILAAPVRRLRMTMSQAGSHFNQ